jgi:hypothetical protein
MRTKLCAVALMAVLSCSLSCQKKSEENTPLVKLGSHTLTKGDYGYFSSMSRFYPLKHPQVWPGFRSAVTNMLETDVLYGATPWSFKSKVGKGAPDWKWKQRYFEAQLYLMNVLVRNLGLSDQQIETYYNAHKADSFTVTVKVPKHAPAADSAKAKADPSKAPTADTAKADSSALATRDSTFVKPLAEVRERIVRELFVVNFPPDTGYARKFFGDTVKDSSALRNQWFQYMSRYIRNRDQDYFLNRYYQEFYGKPLPDSVDQWMGEGKVVTPADLKTITNWLPESEQSRFETPRGQKELSRWVLRWKIYQQKATRTGFVSTAEVRRTLDWVWKYHVVNEYLSQVLLPQLKKSTRVDTAMCVYSYFDERDKVTLPPDSAGLAMELQSKFDRTLGLKLDSLVYGLRMKRGVKFLQADYRDEKDQSPARLLAVADSLRDTGDVSQAETNYRKLTSSFGWTRQADTALGELAKLVTEKQSYKDAIRNYRLFLLGTRDSSRMCNTFFMIGFIYDEYLNQPALAEVNYKWILKNTPACELADDAEFMMLHLDEPMISIEELRAQALRQGRKVDFSDTLGVDTTSADTSRNASSKS